MLTEAQRLVLETASRAPVLDGQAEFQSATALGVSPIICGRLVTMLLLDQRRFDPLAEGAARKPTEYRITQAGRDVLTG